MPKKLSLEEYLLLLKEKYAVVGIKGGVEAEALLKEEILFLKELAEKHQLFLLLKIGGAEARGDMYWAKEVGIKRILAPMIESAYALEKFVRASLEIYEEEPYLGINIETKTALSNLYEITHSPFFSHIQQVTIGRSDLAESLGKKPDDKEVFRQIQKIKKALPKNIYLSIGGYITPYNVEPLVENLSPTYINTRHLILENRSSFSPSWIKEAIRWEIELYRFFQEKFSSREDFYKKRIISLQKRL